VLRSPDGGRTARAVLLPDGTGYFTASTLPAARAGRAYQLWALDGPKAMSARVLGRRVAPAVFTLAAPASGLAITEEQAGGAAAPTGPPLVAASVPRG
jgi:hypothetical protein